MDIFQNLENSYDAPANPMELFSEWLSDAEKSEINDPNAMSLATIDPDGRPSLRIVLLKAHDERGFVFYTNRESRKGIALGAHPYAALCLHWKTLTRQVRIEGDVSLISDSESDAYYNTRPEGSRIGAWASRQSRPLANRTELEARVKEFEDQFSSGEKLERPPHWGGYRVTPKTIEFWHDGASRLHTRIVYKRTADGWERSMLYP